MKWLEYLVQVFGGQTSDYLAVPALLNMPVAKPNMMLVDKGYDGDDVCSVLLMRGVGRFELT